MALFLKIENAGVAPYEGFTLFGATSKRNSTNPLCIGTFGSGGKMAVGTLLRAFINPQVFCGLTKLNFYTKPVTMKATGGDVQHKQVYVHIDGKLPENDDNTKGHKALSFVLDYGTKDWNDVALALREFVSNAIDGQIDMTGDFKGVNIDIVDESKVRAKDGVTRVFIPLTEAVQKFYDEVGKWFLHFSEPDVVRNGTKVLPKKNRNRTDSSRAVIYRRGVYVREFMASNTASLFDYNLDVSLNEARTFNDWEAKRDVAVALRKADRSIIARILQAITKGENVWELTLDEYGLIPASWETDTDTDKTARQTEWVAAAALVLGDEGVLCDDVSVVGQMVEKKGYKAFPVKSAGWIKAMRDNGVRTDEAILTKDDKVGRSFFPATDAVTLALDIVWKGMEALGMTSGKAKPMAGTFTEPIDCEARAMGLYRPEVKTVYAHTDYAENVDEQLVYILTEEVLHHISGATDYSRDFQTLQTQVIGRLFYKAHKGE